MKGNRGADCCVLLRIARLRVVLFWSPRRHPLPADLLRSNSSFARSGRACLESRAPAITMGKLFTAHDPLNVHKTLGGVAVLHALYRLCNVGQTDMGFDGSLCTLACMTWHATLSCSSLIFRIPKHRLMSAGQAGSMIWPEYRLHSILFAMRSLLCMAIVWVEARVGGVMSDPIRVHTVVNIGCVFATLWTATAISRALPSGAAGSKNPTDAPGGTIRDLECPSWMKTFFSNMQVKFGLFSTCTDFDAKPA